MRAIAYCAPETERNAWDLLQKSPELPIAVVSDIEMPRMDGFALAARLRADPRYADLPLIALTSLASEDDRERAKKAGASEYMVKLDRETLVSSLEKYRNREMEE